MDPPWSRHFRCFRRWLFDCCSLVAFLALLLSCGQPVRAEQVLLSADLVSAPLARSGGPITLVWRLTSSSYSLLEGHLEVVVFDGPERLARVATDDLVLNTGSTLHRMLLPTLDADGGMGTVDVRLRFVGPKETIDLGTHALRLPTPFQRRFVIGVVDPRETSMDERKQALVQQFRIETHQTPVTDRTIETGLARLLPGETPADPVGYCGFDILILMPEGFSELKEAQCQALLAWVDAGGSLCLLPGREVLRPHHLKLLNDLLAGPDSPEPFVLDTAGRLLSPGQNPLDSREGAVNDRSAPARLDLTFKRWGLGRVAIAHDDLARLQPESSVDVRRAVAFLWKMRKDQQTEFLATGKWTVPTPGSPAASSDPNGLADRSRNYDIISQLRPTDMILSPIPLLSGDQLLPWLLPRNLRVIPLKAVGLLLVVYVLVIGPLDYWGLGLIKRRRWTWGLFPAVTVGFAVATVVVSNWYMRVNDARRSVTFFDVGEAGRIARTNRFEALFRGTPAEVPTDVRRGLLTAMNHQRFSRGSWFQFQQAAQRGAENQLEMVAIPAYAGRIPSQYTVTQYLPQWTPQLNRLLALASGEGAVEFDWQSLASAVRSSGIQGAALQLDRKKISDAIGTAFGPEASVFVVSGTQIHYVSGKQGILQQDDPTYAGDQYGGMGPYYGQQLGRTSFLQDVCVPTMLGWFSVVSQMSPTGGKDFDDLALLDPSDPAQCLLIVMVERGDDLLVYRRLYSGEP